MVMGKLLAGSRFFCMVGLPIFRNNCRNPRRKQHFRAPIANRHIPSLDDNPFRSIVGSGRINIRSIYALFRSGSRTEYLARYLCCFRNHHGTCHSQHLGCFNVGLTFGQNIHFTATPALFHTLPATFLVTLGGFFTNAVYCLYQNNKNHPW